MTTTDAAKGSSSSTAPEPPRSSDIGRHKAANIDASTQTRRQKCSPADLALRKKHVGGWDMPASLIGSHAETLISQGRDEASISEVERAELRHLADNDVDHPVYAFAVMSHGSFAYDPRLQSRLESRVPVAGKTCP